MRERRAWIETLKQAMGGGSPPISMAFPDFARTELLLYALYAYFPQQTIADGHLLLQGYREPGTTDSQWEILKHLRHLAPEFRSSINWEIARRTYDDVAKSSGAGWLGFLIDYAANHIALTRNMALERYDLYERLLTQEPLKFSQQSYKPAPAGDYLFNISPQQTTLIKIPEELAKIGAQHISQVSSLRTCKNRSPIQISRKQLIEKGTALQSVLRYDAGEILERSTIWDLVQDCKAEEICINQKSHLLGPTGSGKSTLVECLTAELVDQGKRIAIATNSVGEVQDWLVFAEKVGIRAVPIIGESERHKHLSRLNQACMFSDRQQPFDHPGFGWLGLSCPLHSLSTVQIPQPANGQRYRLPCFGKLQDASNPQKHFDCPLVSVCPRHIQASELENAQLVIGTLQGFIQKKITQHALTDNLTILEYLALTTDLFIIDEVDLAQPKLDETFYPTVTLASFDVLQDTWTRAEAYQHVHGVLEGEVVVTGRYNDPYLEQSEDQRHLANRGIGALMYLIRNIDTSLKGKLLDQDIEKLLRAYTLQGRLFTAWAFFDHLAQQLSGLAQANHKPETVRKPTLKKYERSYDRYREIFKRIQASPVRPDVTGLSSKDAAIVYRLALVCGALLAGDLVTSVPHPDCRAWIRETRWDTPLEQIEEDSDRFIENLAKLLQLSIYAAHVLGALGKHVSARRHTTIDIQSSFPMAPPTDFERLLPTPPIGSVTSAQFVNQQLKVFHGHALGRALLSDWDSIFSIDGLTPAHLLVTSATSYSGESQQSYPFHVQIPPTLLIQPPADKAEAVAHDSEFFYCPVVDDAGNPVFISGSQGDDRIESIARMASGLCRPSVQGQTLFDQFQDYLGRQVGSDRKNLLVVTNSYAEAKEFYHRLPGVYQDRAAYVVQDGRWASDQQVTRSKLTEFPGQGKEILIAPIGAISRAVNLMHPDSGEPYFGGMVIVVRQHPSPDDNQIVISAVNKETVELIGKQSTEIVQKYAYHVRNVFLAVPQIFSRLPEKIQGIAFKQPLVWTLTVNLTQLIGRSTRGGRKTVVWFTDAASMPETAKGNPSGDSDKNSILLAARKLLGTAINQRGTTGRLIETLYGPVYYPLTRLTHFIQGVKL